MAIPFEPACFENIKGLAAKVRFFPLHSPALVNSGRPDGFPAAHDMKTTRWLSHEAFVPIAQGILGLKRWTGPWTGVQSSVLRG